MSRFVKLLTVAVVAGVAVLASARPANAQGMFMYRQMPTIYSYYPFGPVIMPFGYGVMPAYGLGINQAGAFFPSPTGGYGFMSSRLYYAPAYYGGYAYPNSYDYSYPTSGSYGYGMAARESYYLRQAQRQAGAEAAGGAVYADRLPDQGAKPADPNRWRDAPPALRQALFNPTEQSVNSGQALNELLKTSTDLEAAGAKTESPFLPPEVLAKVTFIGGPAADALNMVRSGKIEFPPTLRGTEFGGPRTAIEKDLVTASEAIRAGKKLDPALVDRMSANIKRLQAKAPVDVDTTAGLARFDAAVTYLKSADASGLFVPAWQTDGATLRDLSKFMTRYKLQFGPVAPGGEALYAALHRGMVGYVNQLAAKK
jgi:hypothetical protein